jgi:ABC-2 type transport system ATP-binding protein
MKPSLLMPDYQETLTVVAPELGTATIQIRKLHKHYDKTIAIRGIDLEVQQGELFGLIGPDGAGYERSRTV